MVTKLRWGFRVGALALLGALSLAAQAGSYTFELINRPGSTITQVFGLNNLGQAAGSSIAAAGTGAQAFIYESGSFTSLTGPTGSISTTAMGISDAGIVVGSYATTTGLDEFGNVIDGPLRGYVYSGGSYSTFAISGATNTFARAISPNGRYISGYYDTPDEVIQGFLIDTLTSTLTFIGAGGFDFTIAQGISNAGVVVGSDIILNVPSPNPRPGFIYDSVTGIRTDVSLPGAQRTAFRDIDEFGTISGWYRDSGGVTHGFTGYPGVIQTIDVPVGGDTFVEANNNIGWLAGDYVVGETMGAFLAKPVPEPAMLSLFGLGLIGLIAVRRVARSA